MELTAVLRRREWSSAFGYLLFVGALAAGYFYNLTFVQLGLVDLGSRVIGLSDTAVALRIALLAGVTLVVALTAGLLLHRTGGGARFLVKLRLLFVAVVVQTVLTAVAPHLRSGEAMTIWILVASVALGIGVPSMFGLTCDLIPVRDRGWVAALVTSAAYLPAAVFATEWQIERFAEQLLWPMAIGVVGMGVLAFVPLRVTAVLSRQHAIPAFGVGRFVRGAPAGSWPGRAFVLALLLMFGVYFIDSLGFLRIIETPAYMGSAWHSADAVNHWLIAGAHVMAAVVAGILYPAFGQRALFGWVFALFALAQLEYVLHATMAPELPASLGMPFLYAMAVSIYTVLNFTLWADFSTPSTIARNTALGVGISGWLASFLSTALSISWRTQGVPFTDHLRAVSAISLALLVVTGGLLLLSPARKART